MVMNLISLLCSVTALIFCVFAVLTPVHKVDTSILSMNKDAVDSYEKTIETYKDLLEKKDDYHKKDRSFAAALTKDCIYNHYNRFKGNLEPKETDEEFYRATLRCADIIKPDGETLIDENGKPIDNTPRTKPVDDTLGKY